MAYSNAFCYNMKNHIKMYKFMEHIDLLTSSSNNLISNAIARNAVDVEAKIIYWIESTNVIL